MYVRILTEEQAVDFAFNPFDLTKVWVPPSPRRLATRASKQRHIGRTRIPQRQQMGDASLEALGVALQRLGIATHPNRVRRGLGVRARPTPARQPEQRQ